MDYKTRITRAKECPTCPYATIVEGYADCEGEPVTRNYSGRKFRRSFRVCKLSGMLSCETDVCLKDSMTEEEIEERVSEYDEGDYNY